MARYPAFPVEQHGKHFLQIRLPASVVTQISYASVRGRDNEPGAIQRVLNSRRIAAIRDFALAGGAFPANIILNWVSQTALALQDGSVDVGMMPRSAQIIDGQHRVAGLRAAIDEKPGLGDLQIPVCIYDRLTTQDCANIFLAINTEQKPVPRSLVFDLYEVADSELVDDAALRARDIVTALNTDDSSPYFGQFKYPGEARRKGGIALSTAVSELKPLVEQKGDFEQIGVTSLEMQRQALLNFWFVIASKYGDRWYDNKNAFLYAAGFSGGIEFFRRRMIPFCSKRRSFEVSLFRDALTMSADSLIWQEEVKGKGGKDAPRIIFERLVDCFDIDENIDSFRI